MSATHAPTSCARGGSFEATVRAGGGYAVTPAGDSFLFVTAREEAASLHFTVVVNRMAEVKK